MGSRRRSNHPLKSLFLFAVVGAAAYLAYDVIIARGMFRVEGRTFLASEARDRVRERVLAVIGGHECFRELGPLTYRPRDDAYRLEIVVSDGCTEEVQTLCMEAADAVFDETGRDCQVWAINAVGSPVARYLP